MPSDDAFTALGQEKFVSLTTFRRSGTAVSTPVWIAQDGDALVVTTTEQTGKVKRLRNDPRVQLRPCSRTGRVRDHTITVFGTAEILTDDQSRSRGTDVIRRKYGLQFRAIMAFERVMRSDPVTRVILRITR
jgi:PPOX class probable F420-dependent enzyme